MVLVEWDKSHLAPRVVIINRQYQLSLGYTFPMRPNLYAYVGEWVHIKFNK